MSLIKAEYEFLKGNKGYWTSWGAALSVVTEYCKQAGYGTFGEPTIRGKQMMEIFERDFPNHSIE